MTSIYLKAFLLMGIIQIIISQNIADTIESSTTTPTIKQTIILTYPYKIAAKKINNFSFKNKQNDIDTLKHIESNEKLFETKFNYLNKNENHTQAIHANETLLGFDLVKTDAFLSTGKINLISN